MLRAWEVAGASHGDWKLITDYGPLRKRDIGTYPGGYPGEPQICTLPSLSRVPQHMVQNAVYDHTVEWVAYGKQPPTAPKIQMTGTTPPAIARDGLGLALGGIRLAQHEAPLRINSGTNTGPGFCFLDGSSLPLTDAQLATLHPDLASYVDKSVSATRAAIRAGYVPRDVTRDPAWYSDIRELVGTTWPPAAFPPAPARTSRAASCAPSGTASRATRRRRPCTSCWSSPCPTGTSGPTGRHVTRCSGRRSRWSLYWGENDPSGRGASRPDGVRAVVNATGARSLPATR
ncbi:hypothetical protein Phou_013620 [Phytohabitans houttuyneae]|uniref:Alpha/beta hydrolase domain-containing protein n=1 Tax=Phytohabitans houttuyneae TaxID=1076126 RepID=A0A6V8JWY6_9ACTN|nr:alpha/beta hydrolase domain-containing protein [Phytohabitans houttuyneae]GFJ77182.1 hypothetical protein Phou_013620 [Phytohabitans houttuyneae]